MKKTLKYTLMLSLVLIMLFSVCVPVFAANGKWIKSGSRWWYKHTDGTYTKGDWEKIDGKWYLFDSDGWMLTGWWNVDGKTFFLNSDGSMKTGWLSYNGNWFYFGSDGSMKTGWLKYKNNWYYLSSDGTMKTGWLKYKNNWYYLSSDGTMKTGWLKYNNNWYYLSSDGTMKTGWLKYKNNWYYLSSDDSGVMATGLCLVETDDSVSFYLFDENGVMQTGMNSLDGYGTNTGKRNFGKDGKLVGGWLEYEGKKYYIDSRKAVKGLRRISYEHYYFDENCVMQTGWVDYNDGFLTGTAFFDEDGKMTENNLKFGIMAPVTKCILLKSDGSSIFRLSEVEDEETIANIVSCLSTLSQTQKTFDLYYENDVYGLSLCSGEEKTGVGIYINASVLEYKYLYFDVDIEQFEEIIKDLEYVDYTIDEIC